jgi:phosphatidylglycerophosphatase A
MLSPPPAADRAARWAWGIATHCGLGELLPAPGTFAGSLPAALLWWLMVACIPSPLARHLGTVVGVVVILLAGLWASDREGRRRNQPDPGAVVIDETAGQWLTFLVALPFVALEHPLSQAAVVAAGFVLFRLFDVLKPWPVRPLERLDGGVGIMADDLAAGLLAGIVLALVTPWLP